MSREGHGRDRLSLNYRSFMFGKLPPPACPGLCYATARSLARAHNCAHTSCYVEDVSRHAGVGWGWAITFTYSRALMMLRRGTFTCTCAHTSCYVEDVSRHAGGGVGVGWGWGNNVHVLASVPDQLTSCPEKTNKN